MSLNLALAEVVRSVPDCLAAGLVDLNAGQLLGMQPGGPGHVAAPELLVGTASHFFRGDSLHPLGRLSDLSRAAGEKSPQIEPRAVISLLKSLIFVFVRGRRQPQRILVAVVGAGADLVAVLSSVYGCIPKVEAEAPPVR